MRPRHAPLCLQLALAACGAEPEDSDPYYLGLRYETRYASVRTDFEEKLCDAELDHIDLQIELLESTFGLEAPAPIVVRLTDTFPVSGCRAGALGCYDPPYITTTSRALDHELVHAVTDQLNIQGRFWIEGLAEAYGSGPLVPGQTPVIEVFFAESSGDIDYATAGHFTRWLIDMYGLDTFITAVQSRNPEDTYGYSLDELTRQYEEDSPWRYPARSSCDAPRLSLDGPDSSSTVAITCDDSSASRAGEPFPASTHLGVERTLTIASGMDVEVVLEGGTGLFIRRCVESTIMNDPEVEDPFLEQRGVYVETGSPTELPLAEGLYSVFVYASPGSDYEEVEVHVRPL